MEKRYGPNHPETARKLTTLASTLRNEKQNSEARNLLVRALAIHESVYGANDPHVAYVLNSLGSVSLGEKNFSVAEQDFSRVTDIYRRAYGDADYRVAVALGNLASAHQAEKHYPQAEHILLDVVQRFTSALVHLQQWKPQRPEHPGSADHLYTQITARPAPWVRLRSCFIEPTDPRPQSNSSYSSI